MAVFELLRARGGLPPGEETYSGRCLEPSDVAELRNYRKPPLVVTARSALQTSGLDMRTLTFTVAECTEHSFARGLRSAE